jgi:hypothetical protein
MRRQAVGANLERQLVPEPARHAQATRFMLGRQAVARLHFERGHALGHQRLRATARRNPQRLIAGGSRRGHRRADPAAGAGDVLVARALEPHFELACAVAGIDQVGVAVDQAGCDQGAAQVMLGADIHGTRQRRLVADPAQRVALDQQRTAVDQSPAVRAGERGKARIAPQRGHGVLSCGVAASHQPINAAGR